MTGTGRPVVTGHDWMRDMERRVTRLERRGPSPVLLGSALFGAATQIGDWSGGDTLTTGFYASAVGALNSPDQTKPWIGTTILDSHGGGVQQVVNYGDPAASPYAQDPVVFTRAFLVADTTVTFTAWSGVRTLRGVVSSISMGGAASQTGTVTFPVSFSNLPVVEVTIWTGPANKLIASLDSSVSRTVSGFAWAVKTGDGTTSSANPDLHWIATGPA